MSRQTISPCDGMRPSAERSRRRLRFHGPAPATAITSPTTPVPASCTPHRAMAARTSTSGWRMRASSRARGINTTIPYTVDENGAFTDHAPGFTGKRVINDKGEKGDANEAVIKALIEAGMLLARGRLKHQYPHSWRSKKPVIFRNTPQWFVAMDKALWMPCSRSHRREAKQARRHAARPRAACDLGHAMGAAVRAKPHQRHDREPARLGAVAPARLGRADRGVRAREGRRLRGNPAGRGRQHAHRGGLREGRRRCLVHRRRARAFSWAARQRRVEEGRRHPRRLVRFRLDACLRAGRPRAFPGARRHQAQGRRRQRYRDVSGRFATSTAAGSSRRCWKAAAPAVARRSTSC